MLHGAFSVTFPPLNRPSLLLLFRFHHPWPKISELTNFLNGRGVPYEVREWKIGDYGWVVQPDAGRRPVPGEVGDGSRGCFVHVPKEKGKNKNSRIAVGICF